VNRRPWCLALTHALPLPAQLEWIGWWLYTPPAHLPGVEPPPRAQGAGGRDPGDGGHPLLGDGPVFQQVMTLLRHLLHQPFDRDPASTLHEQLIAATAAIRLGRPR